MTDAGNGDKLNTIEYRPAGVSVIRTGKTFDRSEPCVFSFFPGCCVGKSSQRKGREAERELAGILRGYGFDAMPGTALNYGTEPDITGLPGIHMEVKRCERIELPKWFEQAERDAAAMLDGAPVVFFRRNRKPWMVCLRLDDFMRFYNLEDWPE